MMWSQKPTLLFRHGYWIKTDVAKITIIWCRWKRQTPQCPTFLCHGGIFDRLYFYAVFYVSKIFSSVYLQLGTCLDSTEVIYQDFQNTIKKSLELGSLSGKLRTWYHGQRMEWIIEDSGPHVTFFLNILKSRLPKNSVTIF